MSDWKYTEETKTLIKNLEEQIEIHQDALEGMHYSIEEYVNNAAIIRTCKGILEAIKELGE